MPETSPSRWIALVEVPAEMRGRSLLPLLRDEPVDSWRKSYYYHYYESAPAIHKVARHYGVTTETHKLIHFYQSDEWELYDLDQDPDEMNNVYGAAAYAEVQRDLVLELQRLREELGVPAKDPF